jgi:hypothetical protein
MYRSRIFHGVLQVVTTGGVRYLRANFLERLYLLWTFRNFPMLPHAVLNQRQRRLLDTMLVRRHADDRSVELVDCPVIGTVDRSQSRAGVFGVAHQLPATGCKQTVGMSSRRG